MMTKFFLPELLPPQAERRARLPLGQPTLCGTTVLAQLALALVSAAGLTACEPEAPTPPNKLSLEVAYPVWRRQ
jgi:hypothetical protein